MRTKRFASLAAAIVVGGGILLAASGANAMLSLNLAELNGMSLNLSGVNGISSSAAASQGFDFNSVSTLGVTLTQPWVCPPPVDGKTAVFC